MYEYFNSQAYQIRLAFNCPVYGNLFKWDSQHLMHESILKQKAYKCPFPVFKFHISTNANKQTLTIRQSINFNRY